MSGPGPKTFIRHERDKATRRSVKLADRVSRFVITTGGIGTIVAVCAVFFFLLWVVKDLFLPAKVGAAAELEVGSALRIGADEYRNLGWTLRRDGQLELRRLDTGESLSLHRLGETESVAPYTASSFDPEKRVIDERGYRLLAAARADGTVELAEIGFATSYDEVDGVPAALRGLGIGEVDEWRGGVVERTPVGQFRLQQLSLIQQPAPSFGSRRIVALHAARGEDGPLVAALVEGGGVQLASSELEEDMFSGESTLVWQDPVSIDAAGARFVLISDLGTNLLVAWPNGRVRRYSIREPASPQLAEETDLLEGSGAELTAFDLLLGSSTLMAGDSRGQVRAWFVRPDAANAVDATSLVRGHRIALGESEAVRCFGVSTRQRIFAAGTDSGSVHVFFMTSEKRLASLRAGNGPVEVVAIAPKDDALLAGTAAGGGKIWPFDPRYPEVTLAALFGKTWYERYEEPAYVWQSSSGTDDFEPKMSLTPLVFGTIKATVYSMFFGVPLALLAAIFTSEFMRRSLKRRIKPLIELMASLPSVVLGFLAALVIAPAIEMVVPTILASFVTVPFSLLLGAFLWQMLPSQRAMRLERRRLTLNMVSLLFGLGLAWAIAPLAESIVFAGDIKAWLDNPAFGSGVSGWFLMLLPVTALLVGGVVTYKVNPRLRDRTAAMDRTRAAGFHLIKFGVGVGVTLVLAWSLSALVCYAPTAFGGNPLDLRNGVSVGGFNLSPLATYDQRNALIVGFIMGFAIIPIIYTIAEDALSSVPEHLRAASLGSGATPWQTAVRVIIPTAMSGLFSACMIGLGRAVGETMIVLMAAGNTPVLGMNAFSGFRTLSANIATELPEAVRDSTHYRTLFLAALVLFALTFAINTIAEGVRLRFRKRALQL